MSTMDTTVSQMRAFDVEPLKKRWMWFVGLGIVLIVLGVIALGASVFVTLASMLLIGWLLIGGGILEVIHAFACKEWSGFFIDLLTGLLYVAVGFMIVANPEISAISLTLLIALFLIFRRYLQNCRGDHRPISALGVAAPLRRCNAWRWASRFGGSGLSQDYGSLDSSSAST